MTSHTNRWLLWRDLAERKRPTLGLSEWPAGTYSSWLDELSTTFTVGVVDLCGHVRELQEQGFAYGHHASDEEWDSCISTALELERCFEASFASAPAEWLPAAVPGPWTSRSALQERAPAHILSNLRCPILDWKVTKHDTFAKYYNLDCNASQEGPYLPRVDAYPSRPVAQLWNYMRCARLHVLRVMIDLYLVAGKRRDLGYCKVPTIDRIRTRISDTIHDICGSIPFLIGDFYAGIVPKLQQAEMAAMGPYCPGDVVAILWALHKVCAVPALSPSIKAWILDVFERVGTVGNIRQGTNLKNLYTQDQPKMSPE